MKILNQFKNLLWGKSLLSKAGGAMVALVTIYFIFRILN